MTITLEHIEAEHSRIAAMIEEFKKQPKTTEYHIDAITIPFAGGERFAGAVLNDDGTLSHYLILLPGDAEDLNWKDALAWAANKGGELPSRREQSLLFANLKSEFQSACYWSAEEHQSPGWAWSQGFGLGIQTSLLQNAELRARAVRRFIPSAI
jgi:hypothetical protein